MNCILYARVSTDKQAEKELSIPAQLQAMRDFARHRQWAVVAEFIEPGVSAKTAQRPQLQKLLSLLAQSKPKVDVVLVHKIDRLARNVYDHATIRALLNQQGARLASVVENVDDSVPGQLVENIMASIAQFYSGNLSEEVKKGMRQKVLHGGWPHRPPRGYLQMRHNGKAGSTVEVHPTEGPLVRLAYELYATGSHSLKSLAAQLHQRGFSSANGRPLGPAQVRRMLSNDFYIGRIRWSDLQVTGSHEPLVSAELFDRVAKTLRQRFRDPGAKGSVNGFPLRGIAICASCRGHMTAARFKRRFGYYICSRRAHSKSSCAATGYTSAKVAHGQVESLCSTLQLSKDVEDAILDAVKRRVSVRSAERDRMLASLRSRRSKLSERELRLTESFVSGDIAPPAYKAAASKLRHDLQTIDRELATRQLNGTEVFERVEAMVRQARSFLDVYHELNEARQIDLLRALFASLVLDESGLIGFVLRPPFDVIFSHNQRQHVNSLAATLTEYATTTDEPRT